jgi:hypothetical protein
LTTIGTFTVAILVVALALMISGCGGGGGGSSSISGMVRDAGSLNPVAGAQVVAGSRLTNTDATGEFLLEGAPTNAVMLSVTATGYLSQTVQAPAGSGLRYLPSPVYLVPAPLPETGNATGRITRAGQAEAGAVVRAGGRSAVSRGDGTYALYNVPVGFQTIFATSADGLTGGSTNVTIINQGTVTANIQLSTQPPPPPIGN